MVLGSAIGGWADIIDGDALVAALCRDLDSADHALPPAVVRSVLAATRAFVVADGRSDDAARQVSPVLMGLGRRAAVRGHSAVRLSQDLRRVVEDRSRLADPVIARIDLPEQRDLVRCRLRQFLHQVHHATLTGHRQARAMMALGPVARRDMVARALFASGSVPEELLVIAGIDTTSSYVPVVWITGLGAPHAVAAIDDALVEGTGRSALVPECRLDELAFAPGDRVVTGPARPPYDIGDVLQLARQAAAGLRAGLIGSDAPVTSCVDVAAELLLTGRPALTEVLVEKYLAGLRDLRPTRRVEVGEVLLTWLESREPLSVIATRHHVARQTAHDRLRAGKQLVGTAIEDPAAHAAIVVALHASLPRWREEVAARAARS